MKNIKMGTKLIGGFLALAAIAALIGILGTVELQKVNEGDTFLCACYTAPLGQVVTITNSFQDIRVALRDVVANNTESSREHAFSIIAQNRDDITKASDAYEKTIVTDQGQQQFSEFKQAMSNYLQVLVTAQNLLRANQREEALRVMDTDGRQSAAAVQDTIGKLVATKIANGKNTAETTNPTTATATAAMMAMSVIVIFGSRGRFRRSG